MAYQVRAMVEAMVAATGTPVSELRVDGGASAMDLLLSLQADQLATCVARPTSIETTALGAATLAGLAEGVWDSLDELSARWSLDARFEPAADRTIPDALYAAWQRAVERARHWAREDEAQG
jgi:glycerol kinase